MADLGTQPSPDQMPYEPSVRSSNDWENRSIIGRTIDIAASLAFIISNVAAWLAPVFFSLALMGMCGIYLNPGSAFAASLSWWRITASVAIMAPVGVLVLWLNYNFRKMWGVQGGLATGVVSIWYFVCTGALLLIGAALVAASILYVVFDLADCAASHRCSNFESSATPVVGALLYFIGMGLMILLIAAEFIVQLYLYYAVRQVVAYQIIAGSTSLLYSRIGASIAPGPTSFALRQVAARLGEGEAEEEHDAVAQQYVGAELQTIGDAREQFRRLANAKRELRNRFAMAALFFSNWGAFMACALTAIFVFGVAVVLLDFDKAYTASWTWWRLVLPGVAMAFVGNAILTLNYNFRKVFGKFIAKGMVGRVGISAWYLAITALLVLIAAFIATMFCIYVVEDLVVCSKSSHCTLRGGNHAAIAGTCMYFCSMACMVALIIFELVLQWFVFFDILVNTNEDNTKEGLYTSYLYSRIGAEITPVHYLAHKYAPSLMYEDGDAAVGAPLVGAAPFAMQA